MFLKRNENKIWICDGLNNNDLMNWMLTSDIAGDSTPAHFKPYSAQEVAGLRAKPLDQIDTTRDVLLQRMRDRQIAIRDGLEDRP